MLPTFSERLRKGKVLPSLLEEVSRALVEKHVMFLKIGGSG